MLVPDMFDSFRAENTPLCGSMVEQDITRIIFVFSPEPFCDRNREAFFGSLQDLLRYAILHCHPQDPLGVEPLDFHLARK